MINSCGYCGSMIKKKHKDNCVHCGAPVSLNKITKNVVETYEQRYWRIMRQSPSDEEIENEFWKEEIRYAAIGIIIGSLIFGSVLWFVH